jgi:hypothetical protein
MRDERRRALISHREWFGLIQERESDLRLANFALR